jgi:hypothetical protein
VLLNGKLLGTAGVEPLRADVPPGTHKVELSRRGYHSRAFNLPLEPGGVYVLRPPESVLMRMLGTLVFSVKPDHNVVRLRIEPHTDVFEYDAVTLQRVPEKVVVPPGHYNFTFSSPGYQDKTVSVDVMDGEVKLIGIALDRR